MAGDQVRLKRRILQICPHDTPPFGALCERYREAALSIGVDITTVFLASSGPQAMEAADYLCCQDLSRTGEIRDLLKRYAGEPWNLVICHRYRAYWSVARSPLAENPCVVLAHEYGLLARWQRRLNRHLFASGFRFAGVAPAVAAELSAVTGQALVLPNVIDLQQTRAQQLPPQAACVELGLHEEPGAFTIGVVGRLHHKKRPALAVQAFRDFSTHHPQARLVFVGEGDGDAVAVTESDRRIHFAGNVPDAVRVFPAFDVLLHTASNEPFGMVILEAMCAGVPVVALPKGGPHSVLGELGCYAQDDSAEGFARALQQAAALDHSVYAEQARQRVLRFYSISTLAAALDDLLIEGGVRPHQTPSG